MGSHDGGHTPEPKRVRTCAPSLQEAPASAPRPTQGASLACPCPTHLAAVAEATVSQNRSSSHQTGLRGEMSQFNLQGCGMPSGVKPGPHYLLRTPGGRKAPPTELPLLLPQDPSRLRLQVYVPFTKSSSQARGPSPIRFRESEPEKRHGVHLGAGPPHSPKLKVRGLSPPTHMLKA